MGRGTFERRSGIVRRQATRDDAWCGVRYMVFDLPGRAGTFDQRLVHLQELLSGVETSRIELVEQFRIADDAELMALLDRIVACGGEGLMLRKGDSHYRRGRSDDLLKLKLHQLAEAVVVAHLPGRGKYTGMLGSLVVEMPDGSRFKLGTGFTRRKSLAAHLPSALRSRTSTTARPATAFSRFASFRCGFDAES